jgi:hypothetical protein
VSPEFFGNQNPYYSDYPNPISPYGPDDPDGPDEYQDQDLDLDQYL